VATIAVSGFAIPSVSLPSTPDHSWSAACLRRDVAVVDGDGRIVSRAAAIVTVAMFESLGPSWPEVNASLPLKFALGA